MLDKLGHLFRPPKSRPYKLFQIEPSLECNLTCVMCPWRELRPEEAMMSGDTFVWIAEYLPLTDGVDFTGGGEPTTNPRLVEMVRVAKAVGCEVGFSTNGTLLDRDLAEILASLGQDWISFSVDGATAETYEQIRQGTHFETVVQNIQRLHQIKLEDIWGDPAYRAFRQSYEARVRLERQAMLDALVGGTAAEEVLVRPPALLLFVRRVEAELWLRINYVSAWSTRITTPSFTWPRPPPVFSVF